MHVNPRIKLLTLISPVKVWFQTWKFWLWKDWAEWLNWHKSQGNSQQQTRNQLGTPSGRRYIDSIYENNGYAYNMPKTFFQRGGRKFFQGDEALPLVTGLVTRWLGMQKSHC